MARNQVAFADSWVSRALLTPDYPAYEDTSLPPDLTNFLPFPGNQFVAPQLTVAAARAVTGGTSLPVMPDPSAGGSAAGVDEHRDYSPAEHSNFRRAFTGQVQLLSFNPDRCYLIVINDGPVDVRVAFGQDADASSGVPINTPFGAYELTEGTVSAVSVFCVGAGVVTVVEGFKWPRTTVTRRQRSSTDAEIAALRAQFGSTGGAPAPVNTVPPAKRPYTWRTG